MEAFTDVRCEWPIGMQRVRQTHKVHRQHVLETVMTTQRMFVTVYE